MVVPPSWARFKRNECRTIVRRERSPSLKPGITSTAVKPTKKINVSLMLLERHHYLWALPVPTG
jgi:hypothetical protein